MITSQIPGSIVDLAKETASKPVNAFSELIALRFFGKSLARLRAESENIYDATRKKGEIALLASEPFLVQIEAEKAYREYSNLGSTLNKAKALVTTSENKKLNDNDVFWGLLEHSKTITNDEIQSVIAGIVAGEYNVPGSYSMCTLQTIKSLGKKELELFETMCAFLINENQLPISLFSSSVGNENPLLEYGIDFEALQVLQGLGLFFPNQMTQSMEFPEEANHTVRYQSTDITYTRSRGILLSPGNQLPGFYGLSLAGRQLLPHIKMRYMEEYLGWLKKNHHINGYTLIPN